MQGCLPSPRHNALSPDARPHPCPIRGFAKTTHRSRRPHLVGPILAPIKAQHGQAFGPVNCPHSPFARGVWKPGLSGPRILLTTFSRGAELGLLLFCKTDGSPFVLIVTHSKRQQNTMAAASNSATGYGPSRIIMWPILNDARPYIRQSLSYISFPLINVQ